MRTNLALYALYGLAVSFLLAMASFSKYAPTNHQIPAELPPAATGLYAFSPTGKILWRHDLIDKLTAGLYEYAWHFVVIGPDRTLYAGSGNAKLVDCSPDGRIIWTQLPSPWAFGAPIFGAAGQIYAPSGNNLVLIDRTGHVL